MHPRLVGQSNERGSCPVITNDFVSVSVRKALLHVNVSQCSWRAL